MRIDRRQFLKYCIGSAAALGLPLTAVGKLEKALANGGQELPTVVWLNGANCTGCTVSLANLISDSAPADIGALLTETIDLAFHANLMGAAGDQAVEQLREAASGPYYLVVDGGIPTLFGGRTCFLLTENGEEKTALETVDDLARGALGTLCVGTCASFGGIPAGNPNPTGILSVSAATGQETINIPGCPVHPDWIVWTIAMILAEEHFGLDSYGRPAPLFKGEDKIVHKRCYRREQDEVDTFGLARGCLKELGCKGPKTRGDCPTRQWNGGTNWCVGAGALCIGCTENKFPDEFSPFYKKKGEGHDDEEYERDAYGREDD